MTGKSDRFHKQRGGYRGKGHFRGNRGRSCFGRKMRPQNREEKKELVSNQTGSEDVSSRLKDVDVGITEYMSKSDGFNGVIKQRFSDFHVNEIDCDGKIVSLTETKPPEVESHDHDQQGENYLKTALSADTVDKLKELVQKDGDDIEIEATDLSKDDRKKLHFAIKSVGSTHLVSNTKEKDGKKLIIVSRKKLGGKNDRRSWPDGLGHYVHFVAFKENVDTMEAVNRIADKLRIKADMIGYAGTKDRRAKTSQQMCVRRIEPSRLAGVARGLRGVYLGNYTFKSKDLKLGDLQGNRFQIALRNVTGTDEQIEKAMCLLKENGFLNYYGLQRFGSCCSVPTYEVGKALLKGNWKLAVELILKPREDEVNPELIEARRIWWETRDASQALKAFGCCNNRSIEKKLLLGLSKHNVNDYINALEHIPRNTRLLYLHSYQSLLWNKVLSRRIQQFGLEVLDGDLVPQDDVECEIIKDFPEDEVNESSSVAQEHASRRPSVKVLSSEDLKNVSLKDVLLPLPGFDIVYPENIMKEWFEELLTLDELSSAQLKQNVRKYSISGCYRKIVASPVNLSWKTMRYTDHQKTLILSDLEKMRGVDPPKDDPDGPYKALVLDFQLSSSSYATMALREILKCDTSTDHQASLNNYIVSKASEPKECETVDRSAAQDNVSNAVEESGEPTPCVKDELPLVESDASPSGGANNVKSAVVDGGITSITGTGDESCNVPETDNTTCTSPDSSEMVVDEEKEEKAQKRKNSNLESTPVEEKKQKLIE